MAFGLRQEGLDELMAAIQGARSPVDAALEGEKHATEVSLAKRKQAFAEKLAAADREAGGVAAKQKDAALQLKALLAGQPSTVTNLATNEVSTRPGLGWSYDPVSHQLVQVAPVATGEKPTKPVNPPQAGSAPTKDPAGLRMLLDQADALLKDIPSGAPGAVSSVGAALTGGMSNPSTKTYADIRPALAAGIYRYVTGDTRLSDDDAKLRANPLIPQPYEDPAVRARKMSLMRQAIAKADAGQPMTPDAFTALAAQANDNVQKTPAHGVPRVFRRDASGKLVEVK